MDTLYIENTAAEKMYVLHIPHAARTFSIRDQQLDGGWKSFKLFALSGHTDITNNNRVHFFFNV